MSLDWDTYFFQISDLVSTKSKDPSSKLGAVLTTFDNNILMTGYNGFPKGVSDVPERYTDRVSKYSYIVHAEQNIISLCARNGVKTLNTKLYVNELPPCEVCSRLIIQAGIKEVNIRNRECPDRWIDSCNAGIEMLEESGVVIKIHDVDLQGYFKFPKTDMSKMKFSDTFNYFVSYNKKEQKIG